MELAATHALQMKAQLHTYQSSLAMRAQIVSSFKAQGLHVQWVCCWYDDRDLYFNIGYKLGLVFWCISRFSVSCHVFNVWPIRNYHCYLSLAGFLMSASIAVV